jgi:hypothetical protein
MRKSGFRFCVFLLVLTGCSRQSQQPAAALVPEYQLTYSIEEVMEHVIMPNADAFWTSVQTISSEKGIQEIVPRTDDDWDKVRHHAVTLVEATNLLLMPGRRVAEPGAKPEPGGTDLPPEQIEARIKQDPAMWALHVHKLHDIALQSVKAVDMKSPQAIIDAGDALDKACEDCHLVYWYPPKPGDPKQ